MPVYVAYINGETLIRGDIRRVRHVVAVALTDLLSDSPEAAGDVMAVQRSYRESNEYSGDIHTDQGTVRIVIKEEDT